MAQALDVGVVLKLTEWSVGCVESIARDRCSTSDLGKSVPKTFGNSKAMFNKLDASLNKLESVMNKVPRKKKEIRTKLALEEVDYDPGEMFLKIVNPSMSKLKILCDKIGNDENEVSEQFDDLEVAVQELSKLITFASQVPKPVDYKELRKACSDLVNAAAEVAEYKDDVSARDPYLNHYVSMAETAGALGWVVSPAPVKHMTDYKRIVSIYTENILASYIELGCDPIHSEYSEALNEFVAVLFDYVEEHHPAGLKWNYAKGSTPLGYKAAKTIHVENAHVLGDFVELMDVSLEHYLYWSKFLGDAVYVQAEKFADVFAQEYVMLQNAQSKQRPSSMAEMKMLFMPTMHEISAVMQVTDNAGSKHRLGLHLRLMADAVGVLTWPIVQDITPLNYVADIESGLKTYYEKFELQYGRRIGGHFHLEWMRALKKLVYDLKHYVHVHHEHDMEFGFGKKASEVPDALKKKEVSYALDQLKKKNAAKRSKSWTAGEVKGPLYGKRKAAKHPHRRFKPKESSSK
mmetsp:Transcript_3794/g.6628  ORF Transcript_3794/g.6628 Transcript_3794/m.6628 type:complete len:518 (-) Transcript_3794:563-2116(-)